MTDLLLATTNFSWLDGGIVALYIVVTMIVGLAVRKFVGKVDDFLVAGREMNLYLGIASLAATEFGIVTCMGTAQLGYTRGFSGATQGILTALALVVVGLTGFCVKPLRDAGVVTIPELFSKRFGSRIRWAAGVVIVLGGLLNMGVFLRVSGDFLVQVMGVDDYLKQKTALVVASSAPGTDAASTQAAADKNPGFWGTPLGKFVNQYHLELMMTGLLVLGAIYTIVGGMLSVLVTDFLQFIIVSAGMIVVTVLILCYVGWDHLVDAVNAKHGVGGFNPFVLEDMGWPFVVFYALVALAGAVTWQTMIQRVLSAKSTKIGLRVYTRTSFFFVCRFLIPGLWGIAALATLTPGEFGGDSAKAMPTFLSRFLPIGVMGLMVAAMLAAEMSSTSSYMLTWGSVIYNDILAPFRKNTSQKRGLLWNRVIVALIGVFLLIYGLWYKVEGNVWDYLAVTGSIYMSSMAVLLVACCYWKRANSWGATAAIFFGATIPIAYLMLEQAWQVPDVVDGVVRMLPNGQSATKSALAGTMWKPIAGIGAYAIAAAGMIIGSLIKPQQPQKQEA